MFILINYKFIIIFSNLILLYYDTFILNIILVLKFCIFYLFSYLKYDIILGGIDGSLV